MYYFCENYMDYIKFYTFYYELHKDGIIFVNIFNKLS